jgi:(p)ppGpp synthase/HD superfamily hydrolase
MELGCSDEIIVAGILHDTVKVTPVSPNDIKLSFSDEVLRLVEVASEPDKKASWEDRKRHAIEYLKTAPVDVLTNSITYDPFRKITRR